ncbi:hypothetical protein [Geodermatophilus sp. CPCC 206100]|uniref:hypothetical protein n=1 Tax=Geodermatophilus sp. CPCC 206100 TaxID=3020054 RepID=UPI003AFF6CF6
MTAERTRLREERAVHAAVLSRPPDPGPPDAHLQSVSRPGTVEPHTAFLRLWAALSTPVLVLGIGVLLARPTPLTLSGFATFLAVFAGVEAVARRRTGLLVTVLAAAAGGAVVAASLVLALLRNWQVALAGLLAVAGLALIVLNLHELFARPRRGRRDGPEATGDPGR